jgi:hypothetical protein
VRLRGDNLTWRELDGETVILDLQGSKYLTVNASGTTLLKLLAADRTREELVEALVSQYGITAEQAESDVDQFIAALSHKGLLTTS